MARKIFIFKKFVKVSTLQDYASSALPSVFHTIITGRMHSLDNALHFSRLGMVCPKAYNTAEFLISQLSIREDTRTKKEVYQICDLFDTSESYKIFQKKFNEVNTVYNDTQIVHEVS